MEIDYEETKKTKKEQMIKMYIETQAPETKASPRWRLATRIAFRFTFAYFGLYGFPFLFSLLVVIPWLGGFIARKYIAFWQIIVPWVGKRILGISYNIVLAQTGSGDQTYHWVQVFCFLTLAAVATLIWSLFDRKRINYEKPHQWLTLYVRFILATLMIIYGAQKAIPVQMPPPSLTRLVEPYGEFSPMTVLWSFMGSSPAYTSATGFVELLGGVLLLFNRTALLGALVSFVAMAQVFLLNLCYDVPVKLLSLHLVLMSVFLLAPHWRRLANVLLLNRRAEPVPIRPLFQRKRLNRGLSILQILYCLFMVGSNMFASYQIYNTYGDGAPKPPLYGIWSVEEFSVNGEIRPPLITDNARWQRVIIQDQNGLFTQPMRGPNQPYRLQLDLKNKTMTLGKSGDQNWKANFTFEETGPGQMKLAGEIDGNRTEAKLVQVDENRFLLRSRGFRWIRD